MTTTTEQDATRTQRLTRLFSIIAIVEAFTWAGLLTGMYFKYIPETTTELGVKIFGPLHGAAFVCYGIVTILLSIKLRWPVRWLTVVALAAAVPPFTTVVFEIWARRTGRLTARGDVAQTAQAKVR
ncbi:hypothetical protein BAY61_14915 [Prauserella marina]|uniref:Putative drug exporter of the RND superfamily n=1 Tax=Prauserella marina TaxID=530584 RepID=A0A222VQA5_9PSEU|nr:DUF3817 domain-containing protein [Prauserella marina]ASR36080.1 hypothetical protein BAY61_14915 [Prauserella marina]PWV76810.1 integral membrane protein [Prauserella marina]SDC98104.1 putative drug exporter of the RND superfamily [Prauserella marina]